ncbi:hypothetical protein H8959_009619 [Pygathrix nigripes]
MALGLCPETQSAIMLLLVHIPSFLSRSPRLYPPQLASPYGFSMAAADQEHAQRRRKDFKCDDVRVLWKRTEEAINLNSEFKDAFLRGARFHLKGHIEIEAFIANDKADSELLQGRTGCLAHLLPTIITFQTDERLFLRYL